MFVHTSTLQGKIGRLLKQFFVIHGCFCQSKLFLARLLILFKKGELLQLKFGVVGVSVGVGVTFTCGRDNLKSFSCILPKFVIHATNDQFSDKLNNG